VTPYNPKQRYLISPEAVFGLKPLSKYELLFGTLESCLGGCFPRKTKRRPPTSNPWNHPAFRKGKGRVAYLRGDKDISQIFKEDYNKRTSSERVFSKLLMLCMQKPSAHGLNAVSNHCTIAHITVLSIALTATRVSQTEKVRFVKKFLPNL